MNTRVETEREFHDDWATGETVDKIDVAQISSVCTAPEMRWISQRLGDLSGKTLLDVGSGLGEAGVHFAMQGADVTVLDLSSKMLEFASELAHSHGVEVRTHLASAEDVALAKDQKFDVIYAGNVLHHVDLETTMKKLLPHLSDNGVFVSWDPITYNPAINVYRVIATDVRTPDESPLKWRDIRKVRSYFQHSETQYFWLTTLIIFVSMYVIQRRNPNKERFWKVILSEGEKWSWLYKPLEKLDRGLMFLLPPLRLLCWNVVIFGQIKK